MGTAYNLAIIGSGATTIYILKHLSIASNLNIASIHIFEKGNLMGMGLPYNPHNSDQYHLSNISSEEIPKLKISFAQWLRAQSLTDLNDLNIKRDEINEKEVYSRIALGRYLSAQYKLLLTDISTRGVEIFEYPNMEVHDIVDNSKMNQVSLHFTNRKSLTFDYVFISTGHNFDKRDNLACNYYKSPWPISKILPEKGSYYNTTIGLLGASLSAFDVVTSLAHFHGSFKKNDESLNYKLYPKASLFKINMHTAEGWLPHLQYEQAKPMRRIYRHITKKNLLALINAEGYLRIDTYFEVLCKPVLYKAFTANGYKKIAILLKDSKFGFGDFIDKMSERHLYDDPFDGMRKELKIAKKSVSEDIPIYWKEAFDDLMYTLNFHLEFLPAEDHTFFMEKVMPFLMNIIAALPLTSAKILLALHDAGVIKLISGKVNKLTPNGDHLKVSVESIKGDLKLKYNVFIDCSGDKQVNLKNFPFQSLVKSNTVRAARASYANEPSSGEKQSAYTYKEGDNWYKKLDGIAIDATYKVIGTDGLSDARIFDPTFTHILGIRPYSYGLQACHATAEILVKHFTQEKLR